MAYGIARCAVGDTPRDARGAAFGGGVVTGVEGRPDDSVRRGSFAVRGDDADYLVGNHDPTRSLAGHRGSYSPHCRAGRRHLPAPRSCVPDLVAAQNAHINKSRSLPSRLTGIAQPGSWIDFIQRL